MPKDKNTNTLHRNLKIEQHEPHKYRSWPRVGRNDSNSCSTSGIRRVTLAKYQVTSHARGNKDGIVTMTTGTNIIVLICETNIP